MRFILNGRNQESAEPVSPRQLLKALRIPEESSVIELNGNFLAHVDFDRQIRNGDRLEILTMVGGG